MPDIIQRIPEGLLGFLEIKGGQLPSHLLEEYRATMDLWRMLVESAAELITNFPLGSPAIVPGVQAFGNMVVPPSEWWYVSYLAGGIVGLGAAENLTAAMAVLRSPSGVVFPTTIYQTFVGSATSGTFHIGGSCSLLLPPSSGIYMVCQEFVGAATVAPQAIITRLPI